MTALRAVLLLGALLLPSACGNDGPSPVVGDAYRELRADQVMFDVEHYLTTKGTRRALLHADTMYVYRDSARIRMRRIDLEIFGERGRRKAVVTARRGELNTRTDAMIARGDVVVVTTEGDRRIETEVLHFDPGRDRIWSDTATTLYEDGSVVHGTGFTSDAQLDNLRVHNPTGTFEDVEIEY